MATRPTSFDIGRVFERAFRAIAANPIPLFLIALVAVALPQIAVRVIQQTMVTPGLAQSGLAILPRAIGLLFGLLAIQIVLTILGQAAMMPIQLAGIERRPASPGAAIARGFAKFFPLIGLAILTGVAMIFGFLLLIVPALILMVRWIVSFPILVLEDSSITEAMGRSVELTRGARWAIFAVLILLWIVAAVGGGMTSVGWQMGVATGTFNAMFFAWITLSCLWTAVMTTVSCAVYVAIYTELRDVKEGGSETVLGEIFA